MLQYEDLLTLPTTGVVVVDVEGAGEATPMVAAPARPALYLPLERGEGA